MAGKSSVTGNAAAVVAADARVQSSGPEADERHQVPPLAARLQRVCGACLRVAAAGLVGYSLAATAWRARHDPQGLAFVLGSCLLLAALLLCLRRAERLTPESPAEERRRVQAAVWCLCTVLSCAFAYRVAALMPPALAVLVWCMTAFVVLTGLCLLVICKEQEQGYLAIDDDDNDGATKGYVKIISATDELV